MNERTTPVGVLLANLGTPDAPTTAAVRRYLAEFLSDRYVIPLHPLLWQPILHGIVLRTRPQRSARAYQRVWTEQGSPLLFHSEQIARQLETELTAQGRDVRVVLGMRYGNPSLAAACSSLSDCARLIVLPLYPQCSLTTTASTFAALPVDTFARATWIAGYATDTAYIDACAEQITRHREQHGAAEKLLLSFHGLPEDAAAHGDPYAAQCHATADALAARLQLTSAQWQITFQSRFGPKKWLGPYTDATLQGLAADGVRTVDVFCPGFAADCLETLDEIAVEAQELFCAAGGETLRYIPALNDSPAHIRALAQLITRYLD